MSRNAKIAIGLMSGTSADGIDAAIVRTDGENDFELIDSISVAYEPGFRDQLLTAARNAANGKQADASLCEIESQLTDLHAAVAGELTARNSVDLELIGFHGHTILHDPHRRRTRQIGDGVRLARACGVPVVYDFRSEDLQSGGQGAPLAPLFHAMLFADQPQPCAVVNIGGVANVTWLDGSTMIAGDTGPGCGLLDAWVQKMTNQAFDRDGKLAFQGTVDQNVIAKMQDLPFFAQPFPKSADRFEFQAISVDHLSINDAAATLCEVTARSVAASILRVGSPKTTWVTGGGARHPLIMRRLKSLLGDVRQVEEVGLRGDSLEAECFAWLAVRRTHHLPTSIPTTTGCSRPTVGGRIAK